MNEKIKFGFSIDRKTWDKFKYIANFEVRSLTRQLTRAIDLHIQEFEKEHGTIEIKK